VAAEYEVNIKINTKKVETDLNTIDNKIKNLGKSATSKEKSLERIVDKRARLMNRINEMEAKGLKVAKLRKQMGKATEQQSRRDLANAQKEYRILERSIRLEQSKLRILRSQRQGFPTSPIRGIRSMMGSPAQIAASGRQRVSPIGGRIDIAGSPAQMQAIRQLEMAEIRADKNAHFAELRLIQKRQKIELDNVDKLLAADLRALDKFDRRLEASDRARQKRLAGAPIPGLGGRTFGPSRAFAGPFASPIGGTEGTPGSPAFNRALELGRFRSSPIGGATNIAGSPAARRVRRQRLEQVGLGAGFPLLFGGGAGSVIGGGLGGLTGSFGAQIAFSAIGQQIDKFVAGVVEAGKAFTSVGSAADFMAEKSLFSSDAMQFRIEKLIEEGEVSRAAALMTQEMAKQVGGSGLKALKDLGTEASKMGKLFGTVMLRIQAFMAQALTPLIKLINSAIGGMVAQNQLDQMLAEAGSPERRAAILARSQELRGTKKQGKASITRGDFTMEMLQTLQSEFPAIIPEGAAIEPTQLELLRAADTQSSQGEKEEARIQKRLGRLEEERKKILEISRFKDKIAAAEMSRDEQLVIRLKGEQRIAEIEAKRKKDLVDITDQRLIDQININAATEKLAAVRDTERELAEFDRERNQQRLDDMQKLIEQQYELNEAVKQQAALAEGIAQAMGQGMTESFDLLINGAENWGAALQDIAANVLRDIARQLIQIYIIEQAVGFLRAYLTPFAAGTPLGAGGGQVGRFGTLGPNYGIPQFANGGNPPVGRPSIVGERGPELFVPRTAGTIIPNHAIGGSNIVVNVDASGSSVEGDSGQAAQLGKMLGAAVQAELVKQKRPGGLLAS
jgi:hypothetical protein